jgi:hypothetical protein
MINHIELAKECGAIHEEETSLSTETFTFFGNQLATYTNAVIEMCANVAETQSGYKPEYRIRALKVKG